MTPTLEKRLLAMVKSDITPVQLIMLDRGSEEPAPWLSAFSRKFGYTTAAITGAVDRLEKRGLVQRFANATDRRSTLLQSTEAGKALAQSIINQ